MEKNKDVAYKEHQAAGLTFLNSVEGKYFVAIYASCLLQVFLNASSKKRILCC